MKGKSKKSANKVRILVVDDHSIVRQGVCGLLETQPGWEICGEASSGREAIAKATRMRPEVVIMDITLPDLNGLAATQQIRAAIPEAKIVVLSMHETGQMVHEALRAGAHSYVFKSDLARDLISTLKMVIQGNTYFSSPVSEKFMQTYISDSRGTEKPVTPQAKLTRRQVEVVRLLAQGKSNKEVATALGITTKTAETHRSAIMRRLQLQSFSELVRFAVREKMVEL
jgi:DNA-binding NarL/FixJ family response regulator